MLSHRNLTENVINIKQSLDLAPGTVSMSILPIHHAFCLTFDILLGIYSGYEICINDSNLRVLRNMKLFCPQIISVVPMIAESIFEKLYNVDVSTIPKADIARNVLGSKLESIYCGGSYLKQELIDGFDLANASQILLGKFSII